MFSLGSTIRNNYRLWKLQQVMPTTCTRQEDKKTKVINPQIHRKTFAAEGSHLNSSFSHRDRDNNSHQDHALQQQCNKCGGKICILVCEMCTKHRLSNSKQPLLPHSVPLRPWQNTLWDLLTFDNKQFLIIVETFSHYFDEDLLPATTSKTIIWKLQVYFNWSGIVGQLKTHNGQQF